MVIKYSLSTRGIENASLVTCVHSSGHFVLVSQLTFPIGERNCILYSQDQTLPPEWQHRILVVSSAMRATCGENYCLQSLTGCITLGKLLNPFALVSPSVT